MSQWLSYKCRTNSVPLLLDLHLPTKQRLYDEFVAKIHFHYTETLYCKESLLASFFSMLQFLGIVPSSINKCDIHDFPFFIKLLFSLWELLCWPHIFEIFISTFMSMVMWSFYIFQLVDFIVFVYTVQCIWSFYSKNHQQRS